MQVPTIEMDKEEAGKKAAEYAEAVKKVYPDTPAGQRMRFIDEAAVLGFKALAAGKRVINVHTALSYAHQFMDGEFRGLPKLAIARADAHHVEYRHEESSNRARFIGVFDAWGKMRGNAEFVFDGLIWNHQLARLPFSGRNKWSYAAIVPSIPPAVRPRYARMNKHCILWEANWQRAPADPFLLRHLAGDLFTIEAEWDLTELERGLLEHAILRR